jgi:hypothetical protein
VRAAVERVDGEPRAQLEQEAEILVAWMNCTVRACSSGWSCRTAGTRRTRLRRRRLLPLGFAPGRERRIAGAFLISAVFGHVGYAVFPTLPKSICPTPCAAGAGRRLVAGRGDVTVLAVASGEQAGGEQRFTSPPIASAAAGRRAPTIPEHVAAARQRHRAQAAGFRAVLREETVDV